MTGDVRIAVVDDHELVREGLAALIGRGEPPLGTVVYSGQDPKAAAMSDAEVVLLDVDLGVDGPPVVSSVRLFVEQGRRVLLISAFEDAVAIREALRAGALGFVPKRVSIEGLAEAVETVARGELYLSIDLASAADTPNLSPRELDALRLYASGLKLSAVAHRMGISPHTAKEYLDRVRAKYAQVGRAVHTRTDMYVEANRDGLLSSS